MDAGAVSELSRSVRVGWLASRGQENCYWTVCVCCVCGMCVV